MLALTSTLNKLIKRLEEKQSPELAQKKHRKRRVVPQKPTPSPKTAGRSCQTGRGSQAHCLLSLSWWTLEGIMFFPFRESVLPSLFLEHCFHTCLPTASIPLPRYLLFIHLLGKQLLECICLVFWLASVHPAPNTSLAHSGWSGDSKGMTASRPVC